MFLSRFLTEYMLQRDAEVSAEFVQSIVRAERTSTYFADPGMAISRGLLESFFNHVAQLPGVVRANVFSADGTVIWSSDAEMLGRRFADNKDLQAALRGHVTVETGTDAKEEHLALDPRGQRFVESYLPVRDEAGRRIVGVVEIYRHPEALFRAIDEGVRLIWIAAALGAGLLYVALFSIAARAQRILARQQRLLVEAEAFAAIGAVASAVAHGIRNPLASIRSSAELGLVEDAEGRRGCLVDIQREADRMDRWVRDLLLQLRGEAVLPGAVDVNQILAECARGFAMAAARQGIAMRIEPAAVPAVRAEASALGHAVDNLLANAIEAMPEGGSLRLATALVSQGREVEIVIADTGGGLPNAPPARGALFHSTKPRGTGLGLLLTSRILQRYAGTLSLRSSPGHGTTAVIRLPVAAEAR